MIEAVDKPLTLIERMHAAVRALRAAGIGVAIIGGDPAWNRWTPATLFTVGPYRKIGAYELIRLAALNDPALAMAAAERKRRCRKCGALLKFNHACPLPACGVVSEPQRG